MRVRNQQNRATELFNVPRNDNAGFAVTAFESVIESYFVGLGQVLYRIGENDASYSRIRLFDRDLFCTHNNQLIYLTKSYINVMFITRITSYLNLNDFVNLFNNVLS